jgi:hypothetical protein
MAIIQQWIRSYQFFDAFSFGRRYIHEEKAFHLEDGEG